jgi:hypothetical protein
MATVSPITQFPTPANRITGVDIKSTGHANAAGDSTYQIQVSGTMHEAYSGTGKAEPFQPQLSAYEVTLDRAAAEISIWTKPGSRLRLPKDKLRIEVTPCYAYQYPTALLSDADEEKENLRRRHQMAIEKELAEVGVKRFQMMLQISREFLAIDATLAEDPQRLADSARRFVISHEEQKALEAAVPRPNPVPTARRVHRM